MGVPPPPRAKVLPCLHTYCKGYLVKLVKKQGLDHFITCPECRQDTKERWSSQNLSFSRSMTNVTVCLDELACFTLEQTRKKVSCSRWLANGSNHRKLTNGELTALHTVKFESTNQHSVGGKNYGVLTSRRFCALRFDFCVISKVYTVEVRFYFSVFFKFTACLTSVYYKSQPLAMIWTG